MPKLTIAKLTSTIALAICSFSSFAALTLDKSQSTLSFISTKNVNVSEQHTFEHFSGQIDDQGKLIITINIASLNTLIPIRNERMQSMLFNMNSYSTASFTAQIDPSLRTLKSGEMSLTTVEGDMLIAGNSAPISFDVVITGLQDGSISATTVKPTIINATDFGLDEGIEALKEVAKLKSISTSVPLSFSVTFKP